MFIIKIVMLNLPLYYYPEGGGKKHIWNVNSGISMAQKKAIFEV
jgi:hypothetical protein